MIPKGYYIKARAIQESAISTQPPHVREIWDWLLMEVNHKDNGKIKRGQTVRTYSDIQEGLKWFVGYRKMTYKKHHCENAMKWLRKADMITTMKTTRGIFITVRNYDRYQNPKNYENYTKADTSATMKLQPTATINKNERKEESNTYSLEDFSMKASIYLFEEIRKRDSKAKKPDFQKWAGFIEKLKKVDNRDEKEIAQVLRFSQEDQFWQSNILSTRKFRDKYSTLLQKSKKGAKNESFAKRSGDAATGILEKVFSNTLNEYGQGESVQIGHNQDVPIIQQRSGGINN